MPQVPPDRPSHTSSRVERLAEDDDFALSVVDHYIILMWRRNISLAGVLALTQAFESFDSAGEKLGFLTVLEKTCVLNATPDVREHVAITLKRFADRIGAAAVVFELPGFWSAVVRSVITAINIASRSTFPSTVVGDTEQGIDYLMRALERGPDRERQAGRLRLSVNLLRVAYARSLMIDAG